MKPRHTHGEDWLILAVPTGAILTILGLVHPGVRELYQTYSTVVLAVLAAMVLGLLTFYWLDSRRQTPADASRPEDRAAQKHASH